MEVRKCPICGKKMDAIYGGRVRCTYCINKSMDEIIRDIKAYNEKHDVFLTYGKYVEMLELGTLKD